MPTAQARAAALSLTKDGAIIKSERLIMGVIKNDFVAITNGLTFDTSEDEQNML